MKTLGKVLTVVPLFLLAKSALSADAPADVIVTAGEPPLLSNSQDNDLATITITETHPTALQDGYFRLFTSTTPDFSLEYLDSSSATGAVGPEGVRVVSQDIGAITARVLLVQVDADDAALDSITLQPRAFFETVPATPGNLAAQLLDGDGSADGNESGVGERELTLGFFADRVDLGLPDFTQIEVGETRSFDIAPVLEGVEGPYTLESNNETVFAAELVDADTIEITGLALGQGTLFVHDAGGHRGILTVEVVDDSSGQGDSFSFSGDLTFNGQPDHSYTATVTYDASVTPIFESGRILDAAIYPFSVTSFQYSIYDPLGVLVVSENVQEPADSDLSFVGLTTVGGDLRTGAEFIDWSAALFEAGVAGSGALQASAAVRFYDFEDGDLVDGTSYPEPPRLENADQTFVLFQGQSPFFYLGFGTVDSIGSSNALLACKLDADRMDDYRRCVSGVVRELRGSGTISGQEGGAILRDSARHSRLFRNAR